MEFELKNLSEAKPFSKADVGFEISSQGELEQIKPLLNYFLEKNSLVELIFCSDSVEKECLKLQEQFPKNLALLRMPLITFHPGMRTTNPKRWLTCSTFFLCRYDFFPSLMSYGKGVSRFYLLAGTVKSFESKHKLVKMYLNSCYKSFSKIITSHRADKERFQHLCNLDSSTLYSYDFRIERILSRQSKALEVVTAKMKKSFQLIEGNDRKKLIFGSFWAHETELFSHLDEQNLGTDYFLVPHKLSVDELSLIQAKLEKMGKRYFVIDEELSASEVQEILNSRLNESHFYILNFRGILCELYSFFSHAYVGGGFGESVHSLMEPFLADCYVYSGPRVERSTEYDFINESFPEHIAICSEISELISLMQESHHSDREKLSLNNIQPSFESVIKWLEIAK